MLPGRVSIAGIANAVLTGEEKGLGDPEVAAARFLRSVKLNPDNLKPENFEALKAELEAISNALTDRVQKFWHQNPHLERATDLLQLHEKRPVPPTLLPHLSPLSWEHINLTGDYHWPTFTPNRGPPPTTTLP